MIDSWHVFTADFGMMPKPYTALATLVELGVYFVIMLNVGRARRRYKVAAPATDGPEGFVRVFRVQQNTVEQLVFHLPLLWLAAFALDDVFAAALGFVWAFSRILYARGYYAKAKRRFKGFIIGMTVNIILFLTIAASVVASL